MNAESTELKSCPFCGGAADMLGIAGGEYVVFCDNSKCNMYKRGFPPSFWDSRADTINNNNDTVKLAVEANERTKDSTIVFMRGVQDK